MNIFFSENCIFFNAFALGERIGLIFAKNFARNRLHLGNRNKLHYTRFALSLSPDNLKF